MRTKSKACGRRGERASNIKLEAKKTDRSKKKLEMSIRGTECVTVWMFLERAPRHTIKKEITSVRYSGLDSNVLQKKKIFFLSSSFRSI